MMATEDEVPMPDPVIEKELFLKALRDMSGKALEGVALFSGKMDPDALIDWIEGLETILNVMEVDNYASNVRNEVILMDDSGQLLLTLRRKKWCFGKRWEAFRGDPVESDKPAFSLTKSLGFSYKTRANVFVYGSRQIKQCDYQMEGSLCKASCTILSASGEIIAQIKRKEAKSDIMLGNDVLSLVVEAGVDQVFVMGLLIMFNQMS
ncbi:protein LURP-one-related 5-like [Cryptomeria japonica]|uniref:protein LURP-one-related 5-like n=1 Tax=Cryptomeria japonica TaxID=3369 RepID=UPI0025AD5D1E|nr:protein LURP-one-related 5-like [Cryptomeria japonica]